MRKEDLFKLSVVFITLAGSIGSLIGFLANVFLNLSCKWVWFVSLFGWSMLIALLKDIDFLGVKN